MKKINILKESRDFDRIIKNTKPYKYKDYIILDKETKKVLSDYRTRFDIIDC